MQTKVTEIDRGHTSQCWEWQGATSNRGYGQVGRNGKTCSTHVVAYVELVGPIPDGLQIDHLCRNRKCCNPEHLEPVTGRVNCSRSIQATKIRCHKGHPLAGANLIIKKRPNGLQIRNCRVCTLETQRRHRERTGTVGRYNTADRVRKILAAAELAVAS
ncbi:hypothetical protein CH276_22515 [Rhodococcus sp. 06-470-2]|nr:hypothetical protein CH276_22515 [Rhodococcus sp. 06-470-2]OZE66904.1 hypothetical protein CH265_07840 [Rhodococcus sp. 05-2221-1B]